MARRFVLAVAAAMTFNGDRGRGAMADAAGHHGDPVCGRRTPDDIVARLHDATVEAMNTPSVKERLEGLGAVLVAPGRRSSAYLGKFVQSEIEKWAAPIKASGVSAD
jgi:hypothetical protein